MEVRVEHPINIHLKVELDYDEAYAFAAFLGSQCRKDVVQYIQKSYHRSDADVDKADRVLQELFNNLDDALDPVFER